MYYIGIDISKRFIDVCLLVDGIKGKRKTKVLPNDPNSAQALARWLILQKCDPSQAHIIMEATGIYHEHLAYGLHQAGILVSVINPHRVREFAKGMGILTKTDKVDAYVLACYGCLKQPENWLPPSQEIRKLKVLLQHRDSLLNDKQRIENRLSTLKSTTAPEEVLTSLESIERNLKNELARIERLIAEHIDKHPGLKNDLKLLQSIDGVGEQIGWNMLAIIRGNNFRSAEQVAAYLGVIPVEHRSGTSVCGRARLSKIGPPGIRAKLYMGAIAAISWNSHVKALYERLRLKGKAKMVAIGAAMRKLVHLCYGVLHTQRPYDKNYAMTPH
ncbi:IS110 family transposase [Pectobacterium punjabense]|uniref:IS110 family transposase n=1 Tax=Pectobacterium punjabense TaxID=2108399 RepID=A0ABX6L6P0_9GAMM|nr:IS110 family transposase [Pectobacterium punjabense]MBS4432972.1 IS110 family transposase [Pectobacterium punjabense]PTA65231.1 IS110 family transposase [Pectobacterium punjabense]QJA21342.1 IS110 family transposase [Pectobacterium punjabense]QJA21876.1 IS110 family transposase [Pectobacterium punjabense]